MTVGELGRRMSSRELSEWMAFYELEPFGNDWHQTGTIASVIANVNRDPKKRATPFEAEDFIPRKAAEPPGPEALAEKIKSALKVTE